MIDHVDVYPREGNITANNIFVISYRESFFKLRHRMAALKFELETTHGVIALQIADTVYGDDYGQIILRPARKIPYRSNAHLVVTSKDPALQWMLHYFTTRTNSYYVAFGKDKIAPYWLPDTVSLRADFQTMMSSYPGYTLYVRIPARDSIKGSTMQVLVYKVTIANETFYYYSDNMTVANWSGFCDNDIALGEGRTYQAQVSLIDLSGNRCKEIRTIPFAVPRYQLRSYIKNDDGSTRIKDE